MEALLADKRGNHLGHERGFTLPELLVAGGVLAVFVLTTLALVHPKNYDAERHNAERRLELAQIMQAIKKYEADNGDLPAVAAEETIIASEDGTTLCTDLVPKYLKDLPSDPTVGVAPENGTCAAPEQIYLTGYTMRRDAGGNVILAAPAAENEEQITVSRWFSLL